MKVINKSTKVISIGKDAILPDGTATITEAQAKNPVIKTFVKKGWLVLESEKKSGNVKEPKKDESNPDAKSGNAKEPEKDESNPDAKSGNAKEPEKDNK